MRRLIPNTAFIILAVLGISFRHAGAAQAAVAAENIDSVLSAVKATGAKVVLLNVWGQTCSPCMAEMSVLARIAEKLKQNPEVGFIGLCLPTDGTKKKASLEAADKVIQKKQLSYRNLVWLGTREALLERFDIQGTPYNVLLSAEGKPLAEVEVPCDPEKAAILIESAIQKALHGEQNQESSGK